MDAYSEDLRKRIVWAVIERRMAKSEAANLFGVSLSSVKRYVGMVRKGGSLAPKKRPGSKPKLDERARKLLTIDLKERPCATLSERREYLEKVARLDESNIPTSGSTGRPSRDRRNGVFEQRNRP